jgi:hypothetical protein
MRLSWGNPRLELRELNESENRVGLTLRLKSGNKNSPNFSLDKKVHFRYFRTHTRQNFIDLRKQMAHEIRKNLAELTELRSKKAHLILVAMGYAAGYTYVNKPMT